MHSASDFGYQPGTPACIACGKTELFCCDGAGTPLPEAVKLLMQVKSTLEHHRRFGVDSLNEHRRKLSAVEGDIEEWLIAAGFQKSEFQDEPAA
jgi:hypothetical protein